MQEFSYFSAFIVGLLGGVHCVGMCGGIVGALSFNIKTQQNMSASLLKILLGYNLGRLFSYTLAGAIMGGIGWAATHWLDIRQLQMLLQIFAAVFLMLLGLYLAGWWPLLVHLEKLGGHLWKQIEPVGRKYIPATRWHHALILGMLWGWLPCGLVYSVLIWSVSAGSFYQGALLMLCFGLGTLPNLLAMGVFAQQLNQFVRRRGIRQLAGTMVMLFGIWQLYFVIMAQIS